MPKKIDETGNKYHYLRVLCESSQRMDGKVAWWCWCTKCNTITLVQGKRLRSGHTKSCGCLQREKASNRKIYKDGDSIGPKNILLKTRLKNGKGIFQCPKCKQNWVAKISNVVSGNSTQCPECLKNQTVSLGEQIIIDILEKLQLKYFFQYKFDDCINPKTGFVLCFDFYLPDHNCCIEYDGIQHFKTQGTWNRYKKDSLKNIQDRDKIKDEYCKKHNIHLIRVPYTDKEKLNENYLLNKMEEIKCPHI